jgi:hypothetical protein
MPTDSKCAAALESRQGPQCSYCWCENAQQTLCREGVFVKEPATSNWLATAFARDDGEERWLASRSLSGRQTMPAYAGFAGLRRAAFACDRERRLAFAYGNGYIRALIHAVNAEIRDASTR